MARPIKKGIDYFSLDCQFNEDFELFIIEYGNAGLGIWVRLMQHIYSHKGYYLEYNEKKLKLIANKLNITFEEFNNIIEYLIKNEMLAVLEENNVKVLSSKRIQENYFEAIKRRKNDEKQFMYTLIDVNAYINGSLCKHNVNKSTQIKENKIKENNNVGFTEPDYQKNDVVVDEKVDDILETTFGNKERK
jgi:hypothetical protein